MRILPSTFQVILIRKFSWITLPLTLNFRTEVIFRKHSPNCFFCSILKVFAMVRSAEMTRLDLNPLALNFNGPEKGKLCTRREKHLSENERQRAFFLQGICLPGRGLSKNPQPRVMPYKTCFKTAAPGVPSPRLERNGNSPCMVSSSFFQRTEGARKIIHEEQVH